MSFYNRNVQAYIDFNTSNYGTLSQSSFYLHVHEANAKLIYIIPSGFKEYLWSFGGAKRMLYAQSKHAGSLCVVPYVGVGTSLTGGGRGAGDGGARGFVLQ